MKRLGGIILVLSLSLVWFLMPSGDTTIKQTTQSNILFQQNKPETTIGESAKAVAKIQSATVASLNKSEIVVAEVQREYKKIGYELANQIQKEIQSGNLRSDELNLWASTLPHDKFLSKIPSKLRPGYKKLAEVIVKMQKLHLAEDGMTDNFFTKYQVEIPAWVQDRRSQLNNYQLPADVQELVSQLSSASELSDHDVEQILVSCGKKNTNCVDKAFAQLIDANHALNENQLKKIQEYL